MSVIDKQRHRHLGVAISDAPDTCYHCGDTIQGPCVAWFSEPNIAFHEHCAKRFAMALIYDAKTIETARKRRFFPPMQTD
jgi:hypothetical protein